jgi:phage gpG-like protein
MVDQVRFPSGLIVSQGLMQFEFKPSLALSARQFNKLGLDIRSFRVPLKRSIQQVIAPSIGENFKSNGRPDSWTPLSEDTQTIKEQDPKLRYGVDDILRRSGLLFKTMQQYNIWTVSQTQAAILSLPEKIWYGNLHQEGFGQHATAFADPLHIPLSELGKSQNKVYIPQRMFAMLQTQDLDKIQEVFADWVAERAAARLML